MKLLTQIVALLALVAAGSAADEPPVQSTPSGLQYQVIEPGEGDAPKPGDRVSVHYTGTLENGTKFDSSVDRGEPFEFMLGVGQVIAGWDEALALMKPGAKYHLIIPPELAYGDAQRGTIPPNSTLHFDVELLEVTPGEPIPIFAKLDEAKTQTTESGLKYEVIEAGEGDSPGGDDGVLFDFALWNANGELVASSAVEGQRLGGLLSQIQIGPSPLAFLQEGLQLMKPGAVYRFEVPAALGWGDQQVHRMLPAGQTTYWWIRLESTQAVPEFATVPDDAPATGSGLKYQALKQGEGPKPSGDDVVTVHYTGWLTDGTVFDSSHARGEPAQFSLAGVIPGWSEAVQLMTVGSSYRFRIPADLAYGATPPPGSVIPPNADLIFQMDLISIEE